MNDERFHLQNEPPQRKQQVDGNPNNHQKVLFSGLDCLPGQQDLFPTDGEIIHVYTRRQAIEDGVLVQLSGPGYVGDEGMPAMCKEAGIKFPIAMILETFAGCVAPIAGDGYKLAPTQDAKGRLWDVLWMLKMAIRASQPGSLLRFKLRVVPNVPESYAKDNPPAAKPVTLAAVCGPDDDTSPCITIMYPHQD